MQDFGGHLKAHYEGILKCGRQHSCPVCAASRAAERAEELNRLMNGDGGVGRWQMVTLTLTHRHGERLKETLARLVGAFRAVRRTRQVRDIYDARVTATVRAIEVTYGVNGWHPHIHLLLRTTGWSAAEKDTFERAWLGLVPGSLSGRAVVWSSPIEDWQHKRGLYLAKLGAEVAGIAKQCKNGNRTHWQIAELALQRPEAVALWQEYQEAMKGRRLLEFDERAKALCERALEQKEPLREWRCDIFAEEWSKFVQLERCVPAILWELLETATHSGLDPPKHVRITVDDSLELNDYVRFC